jgi:hypothetical protein
MNYKKGLFRIWLVFTILWGGYWSYVYISESKKLDVLTAKLNVHSEFIDKNIAISKEAPEKVTGENFKTKEYYKKYIKTLVNEADQIYDEMDEPIKNLENSQIYGPITPVGLVFGYFVFGWIRRIDFDFDLLVELINK